MEELINELRTFGGLFKSNFKTDSEAAKNLKDLNQVLVKHPKLIPFLASKTNQETLGQMAAELDKSEGISLSLIPKVVKMAKSLKAS